MSGRLRARITLGRVKQHDLPFYARRLLTKSKKALLYSRKPRNARPRPKGLSFDTDKRGRTDVPVSNETVPSSTLPSPTWAKRPLSSLMKLGGQWLQESLDLIGAIWRLTQESKLLIEGLATRWTVAGLDAFD